ncbi:MAG: endonuclease [Bacteroidales bacterium]|nr:endonuclease [Bacteroidales bacterium]
MILLARFRDDLNPPSDTVPPSPDSVMVAFWNLENFFDPFVDSTRVYNEFTEDGSQHWTTSRFYQKRNNIYKAILAFSNHQAIGIMGVCEVENDFVLNAVFGMTPLKRFHYRWVHYEGPDRRGIDPAIVYSIDRFQLMHSEAVPYRNPDDTTMVSRDILYAKFFDYRSDTLHCFVNHWPSKYRGELETVEARNCAARILRRKVDSIVAVEPEAKIVIMGDFNDTPDAPCLSEVLQAHGSCDTVNDHLLCNLFAQPGKLGFKGTLKYQDAWMVFDQIIVSRSLLESATLHCRPEDAHIVHDDMLLIDDPTYHGKKLNRTYLGPKYLGGFSDHLPVLLLLRY